MFEIEYEIIEKKFNGIEKITAGEIRFDFLLGSVALCSSDDRINMDWEDIPLLDFVYGLQVIIKRLKICTSGGEDFDFTDNPEILKFSKNGELMTITPSFSTTIIETTFIDFESAVNIFHVSISEYIRGNMSSNPPKVLEKYLSIDG